MSKAILKKGLGLRAVAVVALAAAVAFSVVLTSTTAEAQTATPSSAPPGTTVIVDFPGATGGTAASPTRFRINEDSDGTASFSNGAQSITCYPDSPAGCDAATDAGIQLRVTIDEDSPLGTIFVQQVGRTGGEFTVTTEIEIGVIPANPPAAVRAYGAPPAAALTATQAADGTLGLLDGTSGTLIGSQLVNARAEGIAGTTILVTTTRGVLNSTHVTAPATCVNVSACTLTTQAAGDGPDNTADTADDTPDGVVQVRLSGNGSTGTAMVTFRELNSGLSRTVNVTLHGDPASISAEVDESTIAIGGSTFIVVTVVDADGNPAVNVSDASFRSNKPLVPAIVGPEVPAGQSAVLLDHSLVVDRDLPGTANDLPSCGVRAAVTADPSATPPVVGDPGSTGTNTAGKCVIQITAPGDSIEGNAEGPADDATRGTHTLTVGTANEMIDTVNVEVTVGGAPASISSDAPASVDSLSSTEITVTVMDDEGRRVGAVPITVDQVEGSGKTDSPAGDMTSDGQATFTYLAPLSAGEAVFLIRAGDAAAGQQIQSTITLQVGEQAVEEPEPEPVISIDLRAGGRIVAVTSSGPATTASALFGDAVNSAWKYNQDTGVWDVVYIPGRSGNFSINTGDILYVDSPIDQTVGG